MSDHLDRAAEVIYVEVLGLPGYSPDAAAGHNRHSYRGDCQCNAYDRSFARHTAEGLDAAGLLVTPERDEAIRADERGRCSVVHATLTDEALVAELVRRGVLREVEAECDDEVETGYCHDRMHWSYCDMLQTRVEVRRGLYERRDLAMGEDE